MPFTPGHPKMGGRQKGSISKKNRELADETFARLNFNPIERLCAIARRRSTPLELRIRALAELARYHSPRLASTVIKAEVSGEITARRITELAADQRTFAIMEELALALAAPTGRRALPAADDVIDVEPEPLAEPGNPAE